MLLVKPPLPALVNPCGIDEVEALLLHDELERAGNDGNRIGRVLGLELRAPSRRRGSNQPDGRLPGRGAVCGEIQVHPADGAAGPLDHRPDFGGEGLPVRVRQRQLGSVPEHPFGQRHARHDDLGLSCDALALGHREFDDLFGSGPARPREKHKCGRHAGPPRHLNASFCRPGHFVPAAASRSFVAVPPAPFASSPISFRTASTSRPRR